MRAFLVRHFFYPLYQLGTGRQVLRKWHRLEQSQWLPRSKVLELQWSRVRQILVHAYDNVPFYRERFDAAGIGPADIRTPVDMGRIPLLTKQDLRRHKDRLIASGVGRGRLHANATGGSTGEPTQFYNDQVDLDYGSAVVLRNYRWTGLELGEPHVMLWGSAFDLSLYSSIKGRLTNWVLHRHVLPAFGLDEASLGSHLDQICRLEPRVITGYSSALSLLARYIVERRSAYRVRRLRAIVSSAETLRPDQRQLVEEAFGCPVFDRYGSREFGCIAHECEQHRLHLNAETVYVEVTQNGQLVPEGERGELVVTSLHNRGFPFIRYLIGDAGKLSDIVCPCRRGLPVMSELLGRVHDILVSPDGRLLPGEFFPHLFKEIAGVDRFQVVQKETNRLAIRIQANEAYRHSDTDYLLAKIREVVGEEMQIDFEFVRDFPTSPSGKTRFTVSEIPIEFSE